MFSTPIKKVPAFSPQQDSDFDNLEGSSLEELALLETKFRKLGLQPLVGLEFEFNALHLPDIQQCKITDILINMLKVHRDIIFNPYIMDGKNFELSLRHTTPVQFIKNRATLLTTLENQLKYQLSLTLSDLNFISRQFNISFINKKRENVFCTQNKEVGTIGTSLAEGIMHAVADLSVIMQPRWVHQRLLAWKRDYNHTEHLTMGSNRHYHIRHCLPDGRRQAHLEIRKPLIYGTEGHKEPSTFVLTSILAGAFSQVYDYKGRNNLPSTISIKKPIYLTEQPYSLGYFFHSGFINSDGSLSPYDNHLNPLTCLKIGRKNGACSPDHITPLEYHTIKAEILSIFDKVTDPATQQYPWGKLPNTRIDKLSRLFSKPVEYSPGEASYFAQIKGPPVLSPSTNITEALENGLSRLRRSPHLRFAFENRNILTLAADVRRESWSTSPYLPPHPESKI